MNRCQRSILVGLAESGESHGTGRDPAAPAWHRQARDLLLQNAGTGHPKLHLWLGPPTLGGGIGTEEQAKPARRSGLWCQFKDRSLLGRLFWAFANLERQ